ncbi:MAG: hypothetical protein AB1545_17655 [Thermodesulfobacteriota bacterium]
MTGLQALDIAIGVIFIYLVLSLACTAANEMISGFLDWRAKNLETGIKNLLTDTKQPGLEQNFYNHPMIRSLCRHKTDGGQPSYIPPRTFSLVLLDLIAADEGKSKTVESIRGNIKQLPSESSLRKNLLLLLDDAQDDLDRFHHNIETWYNDAMDRISGWYKRKAQAVSLIIAFLVSFSLNADTFQIAKSLANDPVMRQAIVNQAQEMAQESQAAPENRADSKGMAPKSLDEIKNELDKTGLPFGWQNAQVEKMNNDGLLAWLTKLAGLLITTLAVSLGAPFWFDVLNKITNIRSAGPIERKKK